MDRLDTLIDEYYEIFSSITKRFSTLVDKSETSVKFDFDERNGWFLYCTNKRANTLKEKLSNLYGSSIHVKGDTGKVIATFKPGDISFKKKDKMSMIIEAEYIRELSKKLNEIKYKLCDLNKEKWKEMIQKLYTEYNSSLKQIYIFLANIDVYCSAAKISIQNGYCRPEIVDAEKSFVNAKDIRHPIVEKIHTSTEYITNDICLGQQGSEDGILLFGTNACGKSTLMKAVGLNIVLAQAGFFVASRSFKYKPYTQIFTRILNNDNIFRSQSSFAVEIQELKSILNRADDHSLVLGDELCSGTESTSALSIITTGLYTLCSRKTSFIFTSHLHQLTTLDEIKSLTNLSIYHLKINYDRQKNILTYDRKLTKGSGPSIYGLQVCEAMGLSDEFISYATNIQNKLENDTICPTKSSQYNKEIFMDECKICGEKGNLETHHIKDQQFADKNKMIDHHHKNIEHNLVQLCSACHLKVTNFEYVVTGWKETSQGKVLEWHKAEKKVNTRKSFTDAEVTHILELKKESYSDVSQSDFVKLLELQHNIKIGIGTLRKMVKGVY